MQKMVWNRYFVGSGVCKEFNLYEKKLNVLNQFRVVPEIQTEAQSMAHKTNPFDQDNLQSQEREHSLVDCFVLCLESAYFKLFQDAQIMSKMPLLINMLMTNPKVVLHGKSILSLFELAFKLSFQNGSPPESPSVSKKKVKTVDSYISYLVGKCERAGELMRKRKESGKFESMEASEQKLYKSLVVAPKSTAFNTGASATFLYEDSADPLKSSVEQEPKFQTAEDIMTLFMQRTVLYLVDQTEINLEKQRRLLKTLPATMTAEEINEEIKSQIPLFTVPRLDERNLLPYAKSFKFPLFNEQSASAGIFGWCFMCRNSAEFYCKDNRVPICGKKCKESLIQFFSKHV